MEHRARNDIVIVREKLIWNATVKIWQKQFWQLSHENCFGVAFFKLTLY